MGIFKDSGIYKGPGIYKSGAAGGGGGNFPYFAKKTGCFRNVSFDYDNDKIERYFQGGSLGCPGFAFDINYGNSFDSFELKIVRYLGSMFESSSTENVLGYTSSNSNYNNGRLVTLSHGNGGGSKKIELKIANSINSWFTALLESNTASNRTYEYKIEVKRIGDTNNAEFKFFLDGVQKYTGIHTLYLNGRFSPILFLPNYYDDTFPGNGGIQSGEYVIASQSYMYINEERIFGFK